MRYNTPLRYPGGKSRLANYVKLLYEWNDLGGAEYVEAYAGAAGMALALLLDGYTSHIHINDIDRSLYAFWYSVLYYTEELCARIRDTAVTMDEWYRQRAVQQHADGDALLDLGFSTFFLNRTNRSGILTAGVIGGKEQGGRYRLHARYNKTGLIRRIERVARQRRDITIYNEDAADFIGSTLPTLPSTALVYLDPPYYGKGEDLYENSYDHSDHQLIAGLVAEIAQKWIVTYDRTSEVMELYAGYRHITYSLSYSAADRYRGSEVMFFCHDLRIPRVPDPAKINKRTLSGPTPNATGTRMRQLQVGE